MSPLTHILCLIQMRKNLEHKQFNFTVNPIKVPTPSVKQVRDKTMSALKDTRATLQVHRCSVDRPQKLSGTLD